MRFLRRGVEDLKTERLRLVAMTPAMLRADEASNAAPELFAKLLNAEVTAEWPPEHWEPHVYHFILKQFADEPQTVGFHRYVVLVEGRRRTLIGAVGGFPRPEGDVEIGYSTVASFQRRGYGTEAARALVEWLLGRKDVRSVSAQTYPRLPESIKVMERCGMSFVGDGDEAGTVRYRRVR